MKMKLPLLSFCLLSSLMLMLMLNLNNAEAAQQKTLKLAVGAEPSEGFDPLLGWSHGSYLLLHSPLLQQNADLSWNNILVDNYQLSKDSLIWTIQLKKDLKFSDGSPLTAKDVAFSYNQAANTGGKADMGAFKAAKAINANTVSIELKHPESTFINVLGALGIVPQAKYGKNFAQHPVGAGPYKLVSIQAGQQLIVEANPYYAGHKNDFNKLVFLYLDQDAAYAAAKSGQLDLIRIPQNLAKHPVKNMQLLVQHSVENRGVMFPMEKAGKKTLEGYDLGNDITADVAMRRAMNIAIDRKLLAEQLFDGQAIPAYTAVTGLPWDNKDAPFEDGNLTKAKDILDNAGWKVQKNGIRAKNGLQAKLTLWYASGDSTRRDVSQAFAAMMKPLGIDIALKSGTWDTVERYMHANPTLFGWGSLNPMELYHHYSGKVKGIGYFNPGYYANDAVDAHLAKAISSSTWQTAIPHWQKVEWDGTTGVGIKGDAAWAWLLNIKHTYLANPCLNLGEGAPEAHGDWTVLNNLANWRWTCQ